MLARSLASHALIATFYPRTSAQQMTYANSNSEAKGSNAENPVAAIVTNTANSRMTAVLAEWKPVRLRSCDLQEQSKVTALLKSLRRRNVCHAQAVQDDLQVQARKNDLEDRLGGVKYCWFIVIEKR